MWRAVYIYIWTWRSFLRRRFIADLVVFPILPVTSLSVLWLMIPMPMIRRFRSLIEAIYPSCLSDVKRLYFVVEGRAMYFVLCVMLQVHRRELKTRFVVNRMYFGFRYWILLHEEQFQFDVDLATSSNRKELTRREGRESSRENGTDAEASPRHFSGLQNFC